MRKAIWVLCVILLVLSCTKETSPEKSINTSDWMSLLLAAHGNQTITLTDITLPASHDAGTYVKTICTIANECNTQTQHLDMATQLNAGLRIFDIRPVLYQGEYYTQHFTACNGFGCKGDFIKNILSQTKAFVDAHSELVILKFSHFCDTGVEDTVFINLVDSILNERLFKETEVNPLPFIKRSLSEILPTGEPGRVLTIYEESLQDTPANKAKGMFTSAVAPTEGSYSNMYIFDNMKHDQLNKFKNFTNSGLHLFEISWTLTQNDSLAINCVLHPENTTSIRELAAIADSALTPTLTQWIDNGTIQKGKIPNIISVDFADKFVTEQCIRLSNLNLQ